jgi:hypothetical protein
LGGRTSGCNAERRRTPVADDPSDAVADGIEEPLLICSDMPLPMRADVHRRAAVSEGAGSGDDPRELCSFMNVRDRLEGTTLTGQTASRTRDAR